MFNSTLEIIIKARDEASAAVQGITGHLKTLEPQFKTMAVAGTVAFGAITAVVGESIKKASEWDDKVNQLNAVLTSTKGIAGVTADAAIKLSDAMQDVTTYDNDAVLSAENLLLTFTKIGKDIFPQATETVLNMATALGEDTKSASIQLGKALQDPILGVTALRKVGVNFSDDQKEVIKKLVETGHAADAQKIILKELETEFGGSARAATQSFGGAMKQLKNQIDDVQKTVGATFLPILNDVVAKIKPVVDGLLKWVQAHPTLTRNIIIITAVIAALVAVVGTLGIILPAIIAGFTFLLSPIGLIIIAIGVLAGLVAVIIAKWTVIKEFFIEIWTSLKKTFKEAIDNIVAFFQPLIDVVERLVSLVERVGQGIGKVLNSASGVVKSAVTSVGGAVGSVGSTISKVFGVRAQGGSVAGGGSYLVGENGPEIFSPSTGGGITANNRIGANTGNGSVVININGGNYLSEDAARKMGDMLFKSLQRNYRGA